MTEKEWLASTDSSQMLWFLRTRKPSDRKGRLLICACCRRVWPYLGKGMWPYNSDHYCHEAVDTIERYVDGLATEAERDNIYQQLLGFPEVDWPRSPLKRGLFPKLENDPHGSEWEIMVGEATRLTIEGIAEARPEDERDSVRVQEDVVHANLIRDIFGNPFRPATVSPAWQTTTIVSLAQAAYDGRTYDRMPILGDALEDAGCDNADVLNHCRQPGEHMRGCWVVDLLLGKK